MRIGHLTVGDHAVEGDNSIGEHRRAGRKHLPFGKCEPFFGGKLAEPGKGIGEILMVRAERIQREMTALEQDLVARIAVVEAGQHGRWIVGDRTGGSNRHAAPDTLMLRRYDLHMSCISAHGVAIDDRIQTLHAQIHVSPWRRIPVENAIWAAGLTFSTTPEQFRCNHPDLSGKPAFPIGCAFG